MTLNRLLDRYRKTPDQIKASLWFVCCSIFQRGISFLTVPIFTRLMDSEQYGVYNTYLSWYNILIVFTSLNLYYGVFNNAMIKFENDRNRYIASMQGLTTALTLVFLIVYFCFQRFFNDILDMETPLVLLLFAELLVTPFLQFWTVHKRFDYKYRPIIVVTLLKSILNPLLGVVFVLNSEQKDLARILSIVLVEVCVCGIIGAVQYCRGKCFFDRTYWKYATAFNLPLIPHYLSGSILNQGDRIMIRKMVGLSETAFYGVAYNIGVLMNVFTSAINSSFAPWIYKELKVKRTAGITKTINSLLALMACLVICMMLVAPEVMSIAAPKEYKQAVYIIPPVAASVYFTFLYNLVANIEFYYEVRKYVIIGSITAAVSNLVLNAVFIPRFGYVAAGYTTAFCYAIYGMSNVFFAKKVLNDQFGNEMVLDIKGILVISAIVIVLTLLINFLYMYTLLRFAFVILGIVGLVVKRKEITAVLKLVRDKK